MLVISIEKEHPSGACVAGTERYEKADIADECREGKQCGAKAKPCTCVMYVTTIGGPPDDAAIEKYRKEGAPGQDEIDAALAARG